LRADNGPLLIGATLPRDQEVADAHSRRGVAALGLPVTFPLDENGDPVVATLDFERWFWG
jgi:hypothetical protein